MTPHVVQSFIFVGHSSFVCTCLTFRLIFYFFVEFWPTRESFGMARGPRFWALGVDSGPRGGAFEGILDPPKNNNIYIYIVLLVPKRRLRSVWCWLGTACQVLFLF